MNNMNNKAPKKVQIGLKINDYDDWEIQGYSFLEDKQVGMTEYTRTDTFIEKACDWLKNHNDYIDVKDGNITYFDMEKCVEDLRKYMRGGDE